MFSGPSSSSSSDPFSSFGADFFRGVFLDPQPKRLNKCFISERRCCYRGNLLAFRYGLAKWVLKSLILLWVLPKSSLQNLLIFFFFLLFSCFWMGFFLTLGLRTSGGSGGSLFLWKHLSLSSIPIINYKLWS